MEAIEHAEESVNAAKMVIGQSAQFASHIEASLYYEAAESKAHTVESSERAARHAALDKAKEDYLAKIAVIDAA